MTNKNRNKPSAGETPTSKKAATTGGSMDKGRIILPVAGDVCPLALNTHEILLNSRIVPPPARATAPRVTRTASAIGTRASSTKTS